LARDIKWRSLERLARTGGSVCMVVSLGGHEQADANDMAKNVLICLRRLTNKERNEIVGALNAFGPSKYRTNPLLITTPDAWVFAWTRGMS
jgi:hypothetical protein